MAIFAQVNNMFLVRVALNSLRYRLIWMAFQRKDRSIRGDEFETFHPKLSGCDAVDQLNHPVCKISPKIHSINGIILPTPFDTHF